ncbi:MAG: phosphoenolpyruvate carboxykinase domain-containing protein, partial [Candidatus Heimdallarchaeota archaeon]
IPVHGIFYGGRDSNTMPPVLESLSWDHGVFLGASIESETTSATLGAEGVRSWQPMANLDFLVVPLGIYLDNHQKFGARLKQPPKVFATNYFLKNNEGKYLNGILDKLVWVIWAEGRCYNDYEVISTPIGRIPKYNDLKELFDFYLNKSYSEKEYEEQFSIRVRQLLEKLDRIQKIYEREKNIPKFFWDILYKQKDDLKGLKNRFNNDIILPSEL